MSTQILTPDRRLRVFLSSRIPEFAAERPALARMIKSLGLTPIFFEDVPRPHPPRDLYRALLAQSDLFIGIYGTGYGWIDTEGGMTISGLHDEWQLSGGMPKLIFIQDSGQREAKLDALIQEIGSSGVSFNRFKTKGQLVERARDAIALCLTERFLARETAEEATAVDHAARLSAELEVYPLIRTQFHVGQLRPAMAKGPRVFIEGSPGCGKTVELYQLTKTDRTAIYVSLRDQSVLSVLSHFYAHMAPLSGLPTGRVFISSDDAVVACESLLRKTLAKLLIDDVDQAPDVASRLADLQPGIGQMVFAGRYVPPAFASYTILHCSGFNEEESKEFVGNIKSIDVIAAQTAVTRSAGSPLYLRYYADTSQPAASLEEFHATMWHRLQAAQKEVVAVAALSEAPMEPDELASVLSKYRGQTVSGIRVFDEIEVIGKLFSVHGGFVRIFHPAFRDFVRAQLESAGLTTPIHRALARVFAQESNLFFRVVHSVRGGIATEVYDQLLRAAGWADVTGKGKLARLLLAAALRLGRGKRDWLTIGLALHQSADLKQHTHNLTSALRLANLAEKAFLRIGSQEAALLARTSKALFMLEGDRGDEAEVILKEAIERYVESGITDAEARIRINLSYLYVRRGRVSECREQCERAISLFEKLGDTWGIAVGTLNLQNYYIAVHDRPNQVRCFRRLLALSRQLDSPRLAMAAYNGMTVFYRREKKLGLAEKVCLKAIALARNLGMWDVEIVNTTNLGNVYRDQGKIDDARRCYESTIRAGYERGSKHNVAIGKELLATIITREGNIVGGLVMADDALMLWREIGDAYREANTEDDQARRYRQLSRNFESGKSSERAGRAWLRAGLPGEAVDAFGRAMEQYLKAKDPQEAARCFESAWSSSAASAQAHETVLLLNIFTEPEPSMIKLLDLRGIAESAVPLLMRLADGGEIRNAVTAISMACKLTQIITGHRVYQGFLAALAAAVEPLAVDNGAVALAFAIEQIPVVLIEEEQFSRLCRTVTLNRPTLRYRQDEFVAECWTVILPDDQAFSINLVCAETTPSIRAFTAFAALLLWAKRHVMSRHLRGLRVDHLGIEITVFGTSGCRAHDIPVPDYLSSTLPCVLGIWTDEPHYPPPALPLITEDRFLDYADRTTDFDNICSVAAMAQLHDGTISNILALNASQRDKVKRGDFLGSIFGTQGVNQEEPPLETSEDDFEQ